ncbi:DNA polymerase nu [Mugil cephalus]|uniref:DNA polymerase nu n=1 Tax=Mugil cephalus TaxID=48193 RepID=UPI001FB5FCB2|nr:DNA polymerase nu [Mugil cephalus]
MEHSSNSLYTGPLSKAAQRILAVLRAQSGARRNLSYSSNHRPTERCNSSQKESWPHSSWSREESRDTVRLWPCPQLSPFSNSRQNSNESQRPETSASYLSSQTADSSLSSQASSGTSSRWDSCFQRQTSQTEAYYRCSQTHSLRMCSEPPAFLSSRSLSFSQREVPETATSFFRSDRYTLTLQTPGRVSEHQAAPWRNTTEEMQPSSIHCISPDEECPDKMLFTTTERPKSHEEEPAVTRHPAASCFKICEGPDNDKNGSVPTNTHEDTHTVRSPTDESTSGLKDGDRLHHQSPSTTVKTRRIRLPTCAIVTRQGRGSHSPRLMRNLAEEDVGQVVDSEEMSEEGAAQASNLKLEMQDGGNEMIRKEKGCGDVTLHNEKESDSDMKEMCFLGITKDSVLESNLNLSANANKTIYCGSKGEKHEDEEENDIRSEVTEVELPPGTKNKVTAVGYPTGSSENIPISLELSHCLDKNLDKNLEDVGQSVTVEMDHTQGPPLQSELLNLDLGDNTAHDQERRNTMEVRLEAETQSQTKESTDTSTDVQMERGQANCPNIQPIKTQCETNSKVPELPATHTEAGEREAEGKVLEVPLVDAEEKTEPVEGLDLGEQCPAPTLSQTCGARGLEFRAPRLCDNQQHDDNRQTTNGSTRGPPASTVAPGQNSFSSVRDLMSTGVISSKELESRNLPASKRQTHYPTLTPSFPAKRKHEALYQNANPPRRICVTRHPQKWEPPRPTKENIREEGVFEWKRAKLNTSFLEQPALAQTPQTRAGPSHETGIVQGVYTDPSAPKQTQQIRQNKVEQCTELSRAASKCSSDPSTKRYKSSNEGVKTSDPQTQSKATCLTAALTSDPRVKDSGKLQPDEKSQMIEKAGQAEALVLTMVYRDGTTQLDPEQKLSLPVCGLLLLMKNDLCCSALEDSLGPNDSLVYLKLEHTPVWAQQHTHQGQELFTRDMLLQVLSRSLPVVCYKAKDMLRTALEFYRRDLSWKRVAGCHIQDPQVSGWLLDPADPSSCYQDLLNKHCKRPRTTPSFGTQKVSQVVSGLFWLYRLNKTLCSKLQSQGLWTLYSDMELNMIPVLAAMESHRIHVDKEALKRTSDLLGAKMKHLEQEAHRTAGQMFLVTSNTQLRTVLFEKLRLHERCENKKLPKTISKQQQSTSEAALLQLQHLHPLPKIILEYRQVHKIKSTFVDGILSCMMSKHYISSTWHQTSAVTGRISAKHPNFQALPRQPLQITKKHRIQGKEEEMVTVHPRAMFIPQEGWTFLAADFCQVELRLLAHLSSDPELLRVFTNPQADVFTMLASQWKGMSEAEVTSEDREHAKRIVYSVVYGAGRERLSGILGVSPEQASRFQDSFLQTYRDVQAFIQRTIQQSHKQGYVLSIMGRRRTLPNINSPDWGLRMQAERQAVNFVVQGSAADLCKTAMIRIFNLASSSNSLSARLIAQLHDELLYEVEDSQVEQFAALVKSTMESLQHIDHLGVHLKVPLKVAVSSGKSWGSMSELNIPLRSPSA